MYLVQILLPLYDNAGVQFPRESYIRVREELIAHFGGLTAYTRTPASGVWQESGEHTVQDDLVIYEVMSETVDAAWWSRYRQALEVRFRQEQLVVRAHPVRIL